MIIGIGRENEGRELGSAMLESEFADWLVDELMSSAGGYSFLGGLVVVVAAATAESMEKLMLVDDCRSGVGGERFTGVGIGELVTVGSTVSLSLSLSAS